MTIGDSCLPKSFYFLELKNTLCSSQSGRRSTEMSEEVMDSSAVSEEEVDDQQEASQNDQSSPDKSPTKTAGKESSLFCFCERMLTTNYILANV